MFDSGESFLIIICLIPCFVFNNYFSFTLMLIFLELEMMVGKFKILDVSFHNLPNIDLENASMYGHIICQLMQLINKSCKNICVTKYQLFNFLSAALSGTPFKSRPRNHNRDLLQFCFVFACPNLFTIVIVAMHM